MIYHLPKGGESLLNDKRPWPAVSEQVVMERRWTYAPPPKILLDAIREWLREYPDHPEVVSPGPDVLRLECCQAWVGPAVTAIELRIEPDGYGSALTVLAYGPEQLADEVRRTVKHRLGVLFGASLRERYPVDG